MAAKQSRSPDAHSVAGTKVEPAFDAAQCKREYEAGATLRDLCAETGLNSTSQMKRLLESAGCVMRPPARRPRPLTDPWYLRADELRAEGMTLEQIAPLIGVKTRGAVSRILNRHMA